MHKHFFSIKIDFVILYIINYENTMDNQDILENKFISIDQHEEWPGHDSIEKGGGVSEAENRNERPGDDSIEKGGGVRGNRRFPGDDTIFTRYLYIKRQVMQSLFIALLEHNREEALFWGYELYYSGFQTEIMEFIDSVYSTIYKPCCSPSFTDFFQSKYEVWKVDNTKDFILGVLIWNLSIRQYDINYFIEEMVKVTCIKKPEIRNKQFRITSLDIEKYKTPVHIIGKGRFVLSQYCHYKIRNDVNDIFNAYLVDTKTKFQYHWEYYAYECPIWQERILYHNGIKNDETERIDFTDDDIEGFYDLYGYEPDEQNREIQERCIGDQMVKQISIKEFAQKYGGTIKSKIIKRNK